MASKHAKLKLALTQAIIDFFLQEGLYVDELKIQGTLCVTADRSAIFVTQITETVNEGSEVGTLLPSNYKVKKAYKSKPYSEPKPYIHDLTAECPEDLTCRSGSIASSGGGGGGGSGLAERQPPAAHTNNNHEVMHFKPALPPPASRATLTGKLESWPLPLSKSSTMDIHEMPNLSRPPGGGIGAFHGSLSTPALPVLDTNTVGNTRAESLFSLNSSILNAAAKSAIERLTSLSRENEQLQSACASATNWTHGGGGDSAPPQPLHLPSICGGASSANTKTPSSSSSSSSSSSDPHAQLQQGQQEVVMDCSSSGAKKRRLEFHRPNDTGSEPALPTKHPSLDKTQQKVKAASMLHSNDLDLPQGLLLHVPNPHQLHSMLHDEPLMLVTPKRERVSDNEEADEDQQDRSKVVGNSYSSVSGGSSSPRDGVAHKLHSPPGEGQLQVDGARPGQLSPWSFTPGGLKEEPSGLTVTDWSSADWMRKPRTKFSQEQLQELETEYKNDPFLSTSADKRAELARRLSITEKNVQIWFQNQRRRRRAAAYSQMHYTGLNDSAQGTSDFTGGDGGGKTSSFAESNSVDNIIDGTIGSPECISDQDGESSCNCMPGSGEAVDGNGKHTAAKCEPSRVLHEESIQEDSNASDLVIATDLSPDASSKKAVDNDRHEQRNGQQRVSGQDQSEGQAAVQVHSEGSTIGSLKCDRDQHSQVKLSAEDLAGENNSKCGSGSPQPVSAEGRDSSDGSDLHGAKEVHA